MWPLRRTRRRDEYPPGSCTRYVYDTVPWVPLGWGDAFQWEQSARHAGLTISDFPRRGYLAVFSIIDGIRPLGHVSLVSSVGDDGMFSFFEGNPPRLTCTPPPREGWPGRTRFIVPPADTTKRLQRGALHNGRGQFTNVIIDVENAWDEFRAYWNLTIGVQETGLQLVNNSLNQFI